MAGRWWCAAVAVGEPGHGGHIERLGADTAASLKEEPRGAGAFLFFHHIADAGGMMG